MKLNHKNFRLLKTYFEAYHVEHPDSGECPNCDNWIVLGKDEQKRAEQLYKDIAYVLGFKELESREVRRYVLKIIELNNGQNEK